MLIKRSIKRAADILALAAVLPAFLGYLMGGLMLGKSKVFPGWSQAFSLFPGLTGVYLRRAFYWLVLPRCGTGACISFGVIFSHPTAEVGRDVYVGPYCCLGDVTLEDDVLLGSNVSVMNGAAQHGVERLDIPIREQPGVWPRITIARDAWLGDRAIILADVGPHCVIGAGSVVTRPVPACAVAVGSPARVVRFRNASSGEEHAAPAETEVSSEKLVIEPIPLPSNSCEVK